MPDIFVAQQALNFRSPLHATVHKPPFGGGYAIGSKFSRPRFN